MAKLTCISSNSFLTDWKPRIYYTGHPADCPRYFSELRNELIACCPCDLYYDEEPEKPFDDLRQLRHINLLVVPVTMALLSRSNRAMDREIPYARTHHIPVLPILVSPGIAPASTLPHKFGSTPYVDMADRLERHLPFREELAEQLRWLLPEKTMILLVETLLSGESPSSEPLPNGLASLFGIGREIDGQDAEIKLSQAAQEGSTTAMEFLYRMYDRGIGVPTDLPKALQWAAKLSEYHRKEEAIPSWPSRLQYLSQLCDTYRRMGDLSSAAQLALDLTALSRSVLGSSNTHTERYIRKEADLAADVPDFSRLLILRQQLHRHSKQYLGQTSQTTLEDLLRLSQGHALMGDAQSSLRRLSELLDLCVRTEDAIMAATALYRLAVRCNAEKRFADALSSVERCLALRRANLGSSHPDTLQAMNLRAGLLGSLERQTESLNLRRMLHSRYRRVLGPLHPLTLNALTLLATRLYIMERYTDSLKQIERAYGSYLRFYGPDFARTKMTKNMYERIKKAADESE